MQIIQDIEPSILASSIGKIEATHAAFDNYVDISVVNAGTLPTDPKSVTAAQLKSVTRIESRKSYSSGHLHLLGVELVAAQTDCTDRRYQESRTQRDERSVYFLGWSPMYAHRRPFVVCMHGESHYTPHCAGTPTYQTFPRSIVRVITIMTLSFGDQHSDRKRSTSRYR